MFSMPERSDASTISTYNGEITGKKKKTPTLLTVYQQVKHDFIQQLFQDLVQFCLYLLHLRYCGSGIDISLNWIWYLGLRWLVSHLVTATAHTIVERFGLVFATVRRCMHWPLDTFQMRRLSMPPVTITFWGLCQARQTIRSTQRKDIIVIYLK